MRLLLLPLLFAATSLGPGYAIVRCLPFAALERFVASIGASLVLIYLATFGIFVANVNVRWSYATTIVAAGITLIYARELLKLISHRRVRRAICGYLLVCAFVLLLDTTMRHFSGADWSYDWLEHFQRSEFFLHKLPADFQFAIYSLPARPPMMNVICAYFMAHVGVRFAAYQVIFTILNSLIFLACCLFLPRFARDARPCSSRRRSS